MMKTTLFALGIMGLFTSCNMDMKAYEEITDIKNGKYDNLYKQDKRQVKRMYDYDENDTLFAVTEYDKEGRIVRVQALESDGSVRVEAINKCNAKGMLEERVDGFSDSHELHTYDEKGRLVKSVMRWGADNWVELYSYFEENKRTKTTISGNDTIEKGTIETIDEKGRLVRREAEYKYNMGKYTETWQFDQFGNEIDYKEVNDKGELQEYNRAEYNKYGLLLHETNGVGSNESAHSWYDYDEQGRVIANKEMRRGALVSQDRNEYYGNEMKKYHQSFTLGDQQETYLGKEVYEYYE